MAALNTQTTPLRRLLGQHHIKLAHAAKACGLSVGAFNKLVNLGQWPKDAVRCERIKQSLQALLPVDLALVTLSLPGPESHIHPEATEALSQRATPEKETDMLLQKQSLSGAAREHFGIIRHPFDQDVTEARDIWASKHIRYIRESIWQAAKHGGAFIGLIGESGSGKTTLVADFKDRLQREGKNVVIIEPSVLYMEDNDSKGRTLKSAQIIEAIVSTLAPTEKLRRSPEARDRQMRQLLTSGYRSGQRHVLLIEEAHCMPTHTLKHLKRFLELLDGLAPLLSIVLVGQPELRQRLGVHNANVREVAQRIEFIELHALDNDLAAYLKFKFERVELDVNKVLAPNAIDALRERLTFGKRATAQGKPTAVSLSYPLAVANAVIAAMNAAAALGAPVVDAAIVKDI
jgi:type II secretory pathway predicted ATPase ExeA